MQRKKILKILLAAGVGAIVGALSKRFDLHIITSVPAFAPDRLLLSHRVFLLTGVAAWGIFGLYWEVAEKNAAPAKSSESRTSRGLHVFLANLALLLQIVPIRGLGRFLPASAFVMAGGLAVEAIGLSLTIWARRHLGRNWSGEISVKVEHELVQSGPYRFLRHPIYTGLLAMYGGLALVTGEWLAVVGLAIAGFAYWRKIRLEEETLSAAFGADYEAYCRTTWALVPGLL